MIASLQPSNLSNTPLKPCSIIYHLLHYKHRPFTTLLQPSRTNSPQLRSIKPQQHRTNQRKNQRQKRQQTIPPPQPHRLIHLRREKRKTKPHHRAHKRANRRRRRSILRFIRIRCIRLTALEPNNQANSNNHAADIRRDPMCAVMCRPAVYEETDRAEYASDEHRRDTEFREAVFEVVM